MFGIIGGVGPRATTAFYATLIDRVLRQDAGRLPRLWIDSIGMTTAIENAFLQGAVAADAPARLTARHLLEDAVTHFLRNGAEVVAMPCNTLQDELALICRHKPITHINMVDETAQAILTARCRRVLILGTASTCHEDLYGRRLRGHGVDCVYPRAEQQRFIEQYIRHALDQKLSPALQTAFATQVYRAAQGCDGIAIACTDLSGDLSAEACGLPVFDSLQLLACASATYILRQERRVVITNEYEERSYTETRGVSGAPLGAQPSPIFASAEHPLALTTA